MPLHEELAADVNGILTQVWDTRDGVTVPTTDTVLLAGGAVKLDATILYADLADSTKLAMYNRSVAAKVFKSFLTTCSKIIKHNGGEIRSFDGDRVMGIFVGTSKNTSAAKCALQINHTFLKTIKPKLEVQYEALRNGTYHLAHCVGIDTGEITVVRSGIRQHNDLIWIGRAPNVAAKLSAVRDAPFYTYITDEVYRGLHESAKKTNGKDMWEFELWDEVKGVDYVYKSSWTWQPS